MLKMLYRGAASNVSRTAMAIALAGTLAMIPVAARASVITVNFDTLDTSGGGVTGSALDAYLGGFDITLTNVTPTTSIYVSTPLTADTNVVLTSNPNYLRQWWAGINGTSYDLTFETTLQSLSVTIPQITAGVIVPSWSLTALDSSNTPLGSFSDGISGASPARTFTFAGPDIAALRVYSNVHGFAGMGGIPIDDLELTVAYVPEPATLTIFGLGLAGLGYMRRRRAA